MATSPRSTAAAHPVDPARPARRKTATAVKPATPAAQASAAPPAAKAARKSAATTTAASAPRKRAAKAAPAPVQAYFRLRVRVSDTIAIGPGKVALLEAIAATGSLTAAAQALTMSYRRAWLLLDELNRSLVAPAVETAQGGAHGGGSILTPLGMDLVERYRRVEDTAAQACAADLAAIKALMQG